MEVFLLNSALKLNTTRLNGGVGQEGTLCTPILRFLFYFNQVAGKVLEKVDGLILMFPTDYFSVKLFSLFCEL